MKSKFQRLVQTRWLQYILGSAISVWAIYLALGDISFQDVAQTFSHVRWVYLVPALLALVIHHGVKAIRWRLFLTPTYKGEISAVSMRDLFLALMAGQMLNLVYPGRIGDLSRIWLVGNRGPGKAVTAGTLVLEKIVDTIWFALMIFILMLLIPIPDWLSGVIIISIGMLLGFWLLLFLTRRDRLWNLYSSNLQRRWQVSWMPTERVQGWIHSFQEGIHGVNRLPGWQPLVELALWSTLAWGMSLLINWLISISLGIRFENAIETLAAQLLVMVGIQAGIAVPSLPGRVGVFEYICMLALGMFGIHPSDAFSYGLLLHIITMLPTMLVGWAALIILGLNHKQVINDFAADQIG